MYTGGRFVALNYLGSLSRIERFVLSVYLPDPAAARSLMAAEGRLLTADR